VERSTAIKLRIGAWCVDPTACEISRDGETARVEARTMRLLLCLAEHAGQIVSIEELLDQVWPGVIVTQDSVYQSVASLRRLLGDDPKQPTYIVTVPRLGYRLMASVSPWTEKPIAPARPRFIWAAVVALCLALAVAFVFSGNVAPRPQKSIAVLPFLDLTDRMTEEPFADGMTEELIDKLAKIPGLRVPAPTSSFYFKGKKRSIADIARILGVNYVLDGSVRKSGARLRVAARLVRADNGFVIWSETYDRPFNDILMVQDDIAGEVTKALRASIKG
jgi:transcriptional activator of cad operon